MPERLTSTELFNLALERFRQGEIEATLTCLRAGIFENVYITPALLGEEFHPQEMFYPAADCEPRAAHEYLSRYGPLWREEKEALEFLEEVWTDPMVRREIERYLNLSKAILQSPNEGTSGEYLKEREWFVDLRRIQRTQSEILNRLARGGLRRPLERARLTTVYLAARDPAATVEFYRRLLWVEPVVSSRRAGGYAEFEMPGVRLAVHGRDQLGAGDPYGLGPPPASLGWGTVFVLTVSDFERYYSNAVETGIEIVDRDLESPGQRFFLVKDPSGYLLEIAESG